MPQSTDVLERSGRRIAAYLAASVVLLVGVASALRRGDDPEPAARPDESEPVVAVGIQAADYDPVRRYVDDFDPRPDHVAVQPPAIEPVPEGELSPDRRAWLADPGPRIEPDLDAQAALEAARAAATVQLQEVLDDRRSALQRACGGKGRGSAGLLVQATFGGDGKLLASEVVDHGKAPAIRDCVASQPFAMAIPATGVEMRVRGVLDFP